MDAAQEETTKLVCLEEPRVDADAPEHSRTQAGSVSKVLDDDNLLREIIIRVGSPTTLVRAALACKRWLEHASDRKFLSRFRELHPPNLLGYYKYAKRMTSFQELDATQFVPMLPQPPELAATICRLESYNFGAGEIIHCQDSSIFTRNMIFRRIILKEEGSNTSYMYVLGQANEETAEPTINVYMLQDCEWHMHTSATCPVACVRIQ